MSTTKETEMEMLSGAIGGRRIGEPEPLSHDEQEQVASARIRAVARKEFEELDLTPAGDYLVDRRGDLFEPVMGHVISPGGQLLVDRRDVHGFVLPDPISSTGAPVFVKRVRSGPRTIDELERERDKQRKAREKAEHERLKALERTKRAPVTAAEILDVKPASLREAAYLIEKLGGKISSAGDELVVELPERGRSRAEALGAARLLHAGAPQVVAALRSKKGIDGLPSKPLRAGEMS